MPSGWCDAAAERGRSEIKARQDAVDYARRSVQKQLIDLSAQSGLTAAREGDHWRLAVLWFARAAQLAGDHPEREELNRVRYANWLRHVWTPEGTFAVHGFRQDRDQFRAFRFSPDGNYLLAIATASEGECLVWDGLIGRLVSLPESALCGSAAMWEPVTGLLAVACKDGKIKMLAPPAFEPVEELTAGAQVMALAFSRDGRRVAWGAQGSRWVWDRKTKEYLTPFLPHGGSVATIAFRAGRDARRHFGPRPKGQGFSRYGRSGRAPLPGHTALPG